MKKGHLFVLGVSSTPRPFQNEVAVPLGREWWAEGLLCRREWQEAKVLQIHADPWFADQHSGLHPSGGFSLAEWMAQKKIQALSLPLKGSSQKV